MVIMVTVRILRLQLTGTPYGDGGQSEGGGCVRFARYLLFGTHHRGFGGHTGHIGAPANFNRLNPGGNRRESSYNSSNLLIRVNL